MLLSQIQRGTNEDVRCLKSVHEKHFIHRDIKPENIVFDEKGFLRITDFGIARKFQTENAKETSGTPGYMAPEVMCRMNHGYEADYYALGVICYESMLGRRPYNGKSRKEIRDQILAKQVLIKTEEVPRGWSGEAVGFINALIQRKPSRRLGFNGIHELFEHPWLKDFNWKSLEEKRTQPPFTPNVKNVFEYLKSITEDDSDVEEMAEQEVNIRRKSIQDLFDGYDLMPEKETTVTQTVFKKSQSSSRPANETKFMRNDSTRDTWQTDRLKKTLSSSTANKGFTTIKPKVGPVMQSFNSTTRFEFKWKNQLKGAMA